MAELATIARPYAEALFQATSSDLEGSARWLDELSAMAQSHQLQAFADSPNTTTEQVFGVMAGVARAPLGEAAKNFLRTVIENGRLSALAEMASQFRALKNARAGLSDAVVYSAFAIDAPALADLGKVLERRFGRKLNVVVELEPSLIGGVRVVVGDEVLDTSVRARLEQMKVALTS